MDRKLITGACALLLAIAAHAQLYIKNSTTRPVTVCLGWYSQSDSYTGYKTQGWWTIEPGSTIKSILNFTSDDDYFFWYAKNDNGTEEWTGEKKLLVSEEAFLIKNADMQYVKDDNPTYSWRSFKREDVQFKPATFGSTIRTYTLTIKADEEISSQVKSASIYDYNGKNFTATIALEDHGDSEFHLIYNAWTSSNDCYVKFEGDGTYSAETGKLIVTDGECQLTFEFNEGNLRLLQADGCDSTHGSSCGYYMGTYTVEPK